jgi:hypothetical protein
MKSYDCGLPNFPQSQDQGSKHCTTCQCGGPEHNALLERQRLQTYIETDRTNPLVRSRLIPLNDPLSTEVGHNTVPNKTVWFKSVSPRPNRITIKVSSPDRPNLMPSQVVNSPTRLFQSSSASNLQQFQNTPKQCPEQYPSTPLKNMQSQSTINSN